jgi:hypothetical protein
MGVETMSVAPEVAIVRLVGRLDGGAGLRLLEQARAALLAGAIRLDIDLSEVTAFTAAGTAALLACRDLPRAPALGEGAAIGADVHYRTSRGPGRDALLAAFAEVCDDTDDDADGADTIDLRSP